MQLATPAPMQLTFLPMNGLPMNDLGRIDLKAIRKSFKLEQEEFALLLGVSASTYRSWEYEQRQPSDAALSLLKIAAARPDVVKQVLGANVDAFTETEAMNVGT